MQKSPCKYGGGNNCTLNFQVLKLNPQTFKSVTLDIRPPKFSSVKSNSQTIINVRIGSILPYLLSLIFLFSPYKDEVNEDLLFFFPLEEDYFVWGFRLWNFKMSPSNHLIARRLSHPDRLRSQ